MKLHEDNIYIEFKDFLMAGWKEDTIKKANLRNGANWQMVKNPSDLRMPMVLYKSLVDAHKNKLDTFYKPNVPEYFAKQPIRAMVKKDFAAERWFMDYRKPDGERLTPEQIKDWTNAASWLNMIIAFQAEKITVIRKTLGIDIPTFYTYVRQLVEVEGIKIPKNYAKLLKRVKQYEREGYECLMHGGIGGQNAAKVNDELSRAHLLDLIQHPNQYDDVIVCYIYNKWAEANGYKKIEAGTVGLLRRKMAPEITASRYGNEAFNEKFTRQVKGEKIKNVFELVECDDYNLNFYYQKHDSATSNKDMHRYVSYIVADSKFGLVLGYCYRQAKSPVVDMVRLAWINAMYYVRQITGGKSWYLPFEIKADGWQESVLHPWFKSIANFVPAATGNKHRGFIEPLFGSPHYKRCEKFAAHNELNYNGNNITAANRGVSLEALKNNKKSRPHVGFAADAQVEKFFHLTRHMPAVTRNNIETTETKESQWLDNWNSLSDEDKRPITDEQFLMLFGIRHEPASGSITITNRGVEPQIDNVKYSFDLPDYTGMLHHIGKKVTVVYDPYDMSRVLVTDDKGLRFIATDAERSSRTLRGAGEGSRTLLNIVLAEKKEQVASMGNAAARRRQLVTDDTYDTEAILLGGYMPKELKNSVEQMADASLVDDDEDYLSDM